MRALFAALLAVGVVAIPLGCDAPDPETPPTVYEKSVDGPLAPPPAKAPLSEAPLPTAGPPAGGPAAEESDESTGEPPMETTMPAPESEAETSPLLPEAGD